jgi:uncharacterized protein with NRDE domain
LPPVIDAVCLILTAWQVHPEYPLVLAANRDEYHVRAAAQARWWSELPILAGRDLSAGGTWLAVTREGRFAALTNYRDASAQRPGAPSRGELVPLTLTAGLPTEAQLQELQRRAGSYNPFNLLFGSVDDLAVYESRPGVGRRLGPGVYGLSNHLLDTPWPKVVAAKTALRFALTHLPQRQPLLDLLRDTSQADEAQLPRTGLDLEWERLLSSAFVRSSDYGTRCSTILLIDRQGRAQFTEWSWDAQGALTGRVEESFDTRAMRH